MVLPAREAPAGTDSRSLWRFFYLGKRSLREIAAALVGLLLVVVVSILLWLTHLTLPYEIAGDQLDPSWQQSLAHWLSDRVTLIFTYGPLGYFVTRAYDPQLFWPRIAWECSVKALAIAVLMQTSRAFHGWAIGSVFLISLVLIPGSGVSSGLPPEGIYMIAMLAATTLVAREQDRIGSTVLRHGIPILLVVVLSLIKLTFTLSAVACLIAISASMVHRFRLKAAFAVWLCFLCAHGVAAIVLAGSWRTLWQVLRGNLELVGGYTESMAIGGSPTELTLALVGMGSGLLLLVGVFDVRPRTTEGLWLTLPYAAVLFAAFKNGLVRHDIHAIFFFGTLPAICLLAIALYPRRTARTLLVLSILSVAVGCGIVGYLEAYRRTLNKAPNEIAGDLVKKIETDAWAVFHLRTFMKQKERDTQAARQAFGLPRTGAIVGGATVDIISYSQGIVFLNGFAWHPRPVFQGYAAYTPYLLGANARYFEGITRPEFVLLKLQTIDGRFPTIDDGEALKLILKAYQPVLLERTNLLFRADDAVRDSSSPPRDLFKKRVELGELVDIGDVEADCLLLSVDIRYSLAGRLRTVLLPPAGLFIEVTDRTGARMDFRLIPGMIHSGFLFDPILRHQEDLVAWLNGSQVPRVKSFRLLSGANAGQYFERGIDVRLGTDPSICAAGGKGVDGSGGSTPR